MKCSFAVPSTVNLQIFIVCKKNSYCIVGVYKYLCACLLCTVYYMLIHCYYSTLSQCYHSNELEKRRAYDERVREIEHGSFSPLVFLTSGGMGSTDIVVYKGLASMIADKQDQSYSRTMHWLHCRLNFSLLHSTIMCLRGYQSTIQIGRASCRERV